MAADARQAITDQVGLDRLRPLISDLQQLVQALPAAAAATAGAGSQTSGNGSGDGSAAGREDEEVVDAEFTRE
jgi:molecular chaperone DnaK